MRPRPSRRSFRWNLHSKEARLGALYADKEEWSRKAILNIAGSGSFSSDHTIAEYASQIWDAKPCPLDVEGEYASSFRVKAPPV
jgi:hypothetical protein